jgi:integrase
MDTHFGVRIEPTKKGFTRTWIVRFRDGARWTKRAIGRVEKVDYLLAKEQALRLRRIGANRRDDVVVNTLKQSYDGYVLLKSPTWAQSTKDDYEKGINLVKDWWHRKIDAFSPGEITDRFTKIMKDVSETPKAKLAGYDGRATAISVMRLLRALFNIAKAHHIITFNPCSALVALGVFKRQRRKAKPIPAVTLPTFWHWVNNSCHGTVRDYILTALFTGFRLSVLNALAWEHYSDVPLWRQVRTSGLGSDQYHGPSARLSRSSRLSARVGLRARVRRTRFAAIGGQWVSRGTRHSRLCT